MASRYLEPRLERASRADMRRLQTRRLREQVAHAARHSPFYRKKLRGARVDPRRVRTLDDLARLPFTTKDELKDDQAAHPPWGELLAVPFADVLRVHLTSATTGRPLAFLDTAEAHLKLGRQAMARKDFALAAREFQFALERNRMLTPAREGLLEAQKRIGR